MPTAYKTIYDELKRAHAGDLEKAKADNTSFYSAQANSTNKLYDEKVDNQSKAYEDSYRENAIQKLINERQVAENMANLGLTNSGLNRTQQTAVQLSYANNKAGIDRQKQSAISDLNLARTQALDTIEQKRLADEASIIQNYENMLNKSAQSIVQEQIKAENERIKQQQENEKNRNVEIKNLYSYLSENSGDIDYAANLIDSFGEKYDINDTELTVLLKAAGITLDEYKNYLNTGSAYSSNRYSSESIDGGRIVGDYTTLGKQNYVIKVKKDTTNFGWGVDRNDVVDIYYPDGKTILKKDVKLSDLSRDNALLLTKNTKGNSGKTLTVPMDLSKENKLFSNKKSFLERFIDDYNYNG